MVTLHLKHISGSSYSPDHPPGSGTTIWTSSLSTKPEPLYCFQLRLKIMTSNVHTFRFVFFNTVNSFECSGVVNDLCWLWRCTGGFPPQRAVSLLDGLITVMLIKRIGQSQPVIDIHLRDGPWVFSVPPRQG